MAAEKTRTTHVKRKVGTGGWIDVERADAVISRQGQGPSYKKTTRKMFWGDESNDAAHPTRQMTEVRIEDPSDADNFVPLDIIGKQSTKQGQGPSYLKSTKKYINDRETNQIREVSIRRVYHWDTEPNPPYARIPGTENRDEYVDTAVIERFISRQGQGPGFKQRTVRLNTDPIKAFSEPAPADVDMSKVVYLDPWQNIINVHWDHDQFIAVWVRTRPSGLDLRYVKLHQDFSGIPNPHPWTTVALFTEGEWRQFISSDSLPEGELDTRPRLAELGITISGFTITAGDGVSIGSHLLWGNFEAEFGASVSDYSLYNFLVPDGAVEITDGPANLLTPGAVGFGDKFWKGFDANWRLDRPDKPVVDGAFPDMANIAVNWNGESFVPIGWRRTRVTLGFDLFHPDFWILFAREGSRLTT